MVTNVATALNRTTSEMKHRLRRFRRDDNDGDESSCVVVVVVLVLEFMVGMWERECHGHVGEQALPMDFCKQSENLSWSGHLANI